MYYVIIRECRHNLRITSSSSSCYVNIVAWTELEITDVRSDQLVFIVVVDRVFIDLFVCGILVSLLFSFVELGMISFQISSSHFFLSTHTSNAYCGTVFLKKLETSKFPSKNFKRNEFENFFELNENISSFYQGKLIHVSM